MRTTFNIDNIHNYEISIETKDDIQFDFISESLKKFGKFYSNKYKDNFGGNWYSEGIYTDLTKENLLKDIRQTIFTANNQSFAVDIMITFNVRETYSFDSW
ncbi:MAG: hypothetical protein AABY32_01545 [Nanoarchaeota archaeon]